MTSMSSLPEAKRPDQYSAAMALAGYIDALNDIPQDVLMYACRLFRHGDAGRGFFPSSAELRQECIRIMRSIRHSAPLARSNGDERKMLTNDAGEPLAASYDRNRRIEFLAEMKKKYHFDNSSFAEGQMTEEDFKAKYPDADLDSLPDQPDPKGWQKPKGAF